LREFQSNVERAANLRKTQRFARGKNESNGIGNGIDLGVASFFNKPLRGHPLQDTTQTGGARFDSAARGDLALESFQYRADPLADATVAQMLGEWSISAADDVQTTIRANAAHWLRIQEANRLMAQWIDNASLTNWQPLAADGKPSDSAVARVLQDYVRKAQALPDWIDISQVNRAETIFTENGVLSCLILFCASLPECYVLPDLSDVLHAAGQLEKHTEHRIRATAAMIFPVMMRGGLTSPHGSGIAQVLKVRLIHAMIRNLILHGEPQAVLAVTQSVDDDAAGVIEKHDLPVGAGNMYETLFAHGWNLRRDGLPCNQEELGYTLLTFHYVFLRSLRTLHLPLSDQDERAYLHTWNAMAHALGVERTLMPETMADAESMFTKMQARGRADASKRPGDEDPRPKLGQALMASMENAIPFRSLKGIPSLLATTLCGKAVAADIGILGRAGWVSKVIYAIGMALVRLIDGVARLFFPNFSLSRMLTRVVGYQMMSKFLMDRTRPLRLPDHLLNQIDDMMDSWSDDKTAPRWLNRLEDRWTTRGSWRTAARR
jgi:ER-bound oxygenase mpaB/B'/Rubber oxygenase, catalytic domain